MARLLNGKRLNPAVFEAVALQMYEMYRYGYMMKSSNEPFLDLKVFCRNAKEITQGMKKNKPVLSSELK